MELQNSLCDRGLAAAGLSDQCQRFSARDIERDILDGTQRYTAAESIRHVQFPDAQKCGIVWQAAHERTGFQQR